MTLCRCIARSKTCENLPKPVKPKQCRWANWHEIEQGESCPWANYLLKKKGVRRAHVRFMVEEKGASKTFGEVAVEEKQDENIKEDQKPFIRSNSRFDSRRKDKTGLVSKRRRNIGTGGTGYMGQAEARLEIERLMKGKR